MYAPSYAEVKVVVSVLVRHKQKLENLNSTAGEMAPSFLDLGRFDWRSVHKLCNMLFAHRHSSYLQAPNLFKSAGSRISN